MTLVESKIRESSMAFDKLVWPVMIDKLGGGSYVPVETRATLEGVKELDMLAGIDAWQIMPDNKGMRGIAQRAQKNIDFKTFTIRYSIGYGCNYTEYQKRYDAINSTDGLLYPHYTIQAYYTTTCDDIPDRLLSVAAIKTRDLIAYVDNHKDSISKLTNKQDGSVFIVVKWDDLLRDDIELLTA